MVNSSLHSNFSTLQTGQKALQLRDRPTRFILVQGTVFPEDYVPPGLCFKAGLLNTEEGDHVTMPSDIFSKSPRRD